MAMTDWTTSGDGSSSFGTDIKYAGNSSCKITYVDLLNATVYVTHDTFLEPRATVIFWSYRSGTSSRPTNVGVEHSSYGALSNGQTVYDSWEKFRATFWYDISSNTRFGRMEKWNVSAWEAVGTDTDFGTDSPAAGTIKLKSVSSFMITAHTYFDGVEISA
jgi:hypothetical protein